MVINIRSCIIRNYLILPNEIFLYLLQFQSYGLSYLHYRPLCILHSFIPIVKYNTIL